MNFVEIKFSNHSLSLHKTPSFETPDEETGNGLSSKRISVLTSIKLKVLFRLAKLRPQIPVFALKKVEIMAIFRRLFMIVTVIIVGVTVSMML